MYLDANNLYGWAMSQYLPTGGFRWHTEKEVNKIDLAKYKEDSKKGLILEVNLEYPQELHNIHNDYPFVPEKMKVTKEMLSPYCESIREKFNISINQVHKLIPTLNKKERYVLHYRNLTAIHQSAGAAEGVRGWSDHLRKASTTHLLVRPKF